KPRLEPQVHKPKDRMLVIKIEVHAFAVFEHGSDAPNFVGPTGLNTAQNRDETSLHRILSSDLACRLLFGKFGRIEIFPGTPRLLGHLLGTLHNPSGQAQGVVFESFEQHFTEKQIAQQYTGLIEAAQGAPEPQAVKATKNSDDIGGMFGYKRRSDVVRCCCLFHNATDCGVPIGSVTLFDGGQALLSASAPAMAVMRHKRYRGFGLFEVQRSKFNVQGSAPFGTSLWFRLRRPGDSAPYLY